MRKLLLSMLALSTIFLFSNCEKDKIPANFDYHGNKAYFDIDITDSTRCNSCVSVYFNADSMAKANKFDLNLVKSINLTSVRFTILDSHPQPYDFTLINTLDGYVGPAGSSQAIFNGTSVNQSVNEVTLNTIVQDIKPMVISNRTFNMCLDAALNDTIKHKFKMEAYFTYEINFIK
jgi:hypothetical protein